MNLNLQRPIVFFDLETTGIDVATDRIVEICLLKINPDGTEKVKTWRLNPQKPISKEATAVHGIRDEDVKDCPTFNDIAKIIEKEFEGADLAGYNSNKFDIPLLVEEFLRVDVDIDLKKKNFVDVQVVFYKMEQRTLSAAYKFYCNSDLTNAHSAEADTRATFEILKAQLDRYKNIDFTDNRGNVSTGVVNDMEALAKFTAQNQFADYAGRLAYDEQGREVFNFGKHKGKLVEEILEKEPGYYGWMMNGDFPLYTKKVLTQIKLRKFGK
jgi:DNA polymerase III subunit epsilon